jgi:hypothetical protein
LLQQLLLLLLLLLLAGKLALLRVVNCTTNTAVQVCSRRCMQECWAVFDVTNV